jgi:hypothetical protein
MYYFIRKQNDAQKLEKKMEATPNTEEEPLELANAS